MLEWVEMGKAGGKVLDNRWTEEWISEDGYWERDKWVSVLTVFSRI